MLFTEVILIIRRAEQDILISHKKVKKFCIPNYATICNAEKVTIMETCRYRIISKNISPKFYCRALKIKNFIIRKQRETILGNTKQYKVSLTF